MNKQKYLSRGAVVLCLLLLMLAGGCKKKAPMTPPPPPPPPPPAAAPTATLSASPTTIERGQSSTLSWTTTGATAVSIDQGIGDVSTSGSRSVSPSSSTTYTLTAKGEGGSTTATARITITAPPPPPPTPRPVVTETLEEAFAKNVRDVYFDYDKSDIRDDQKSTLADAAASRSNGTRSTATPKVARRVRGDATDPLDRVAYDPSDNMTRAEPEETASYFVDLPASPRLAVPPRLPITPRPIPDVRRLSVREAVRALHGAGFRVRVVAAASSGTLPAAGTMAAPGTLVQLTRPLE